MSEYQGTRHDVRYLGIQTGLVAVYADGNRLCRMPSAYITDEEFSLVTKKT